jgi:flagellar biosynthesis protein FlhA
MALGRAITRQIMDGQSELHVISLEPGLERTLSQALSTGGAEAMALEPGLAQMLIEQSVQAAEQQDDQGLPAVLLVPASLRWPLSRFLRRVIPQLHVLANAEIPDACTVRVVSLIGGRKS